MSQDKNNIWRTPNAQQLADTLLALKDGPTLRNFLRDVMTEKEIVEISARFEAAKMLTDGKKYSEIVATTKLSSRTVARINEWLRNGCDGYAAALKTIHHPHMLPARAD